MVDYNKYFEVRDTILELVPGIANEEILAKRICELFDTQKTVIIGNIPTIAPKIYDIKPTFTDGGIVPLDLNRVTC